MSSLEEIAQAWREAGARAVHPELSDDGSPISGFAAAETVAELERAARYVGRPIAELDLLDYGAGPGRIAREVVGRWRHVILADVSPTYLELARIQLGEVAGYELLEVDPLPAALPAVDVVLCVAVLIHIPRELAGELLEVLARALRPGGILAAQMPIYEEAAPPAGWTDVGTYTSRDVRILADEADLEIRELYVNPGRFAYDAIGRYHRRLQILQRPPTRGTT